MKTETLLVKSNRRIEFIDITSHVEGVVERSKVKNGFCFLFVPHTTAAIMLNENYDPSVLEDIANTLEKIAPENASYAHLEGNAHAHIRNAILGSSLHIPIISGKLALGTWQGILFCEFDGPRERKVIIQIIE